MTLAESAPNPMLAPCSIAPVPTAVRRRGLCALRDRLAARIGTSSDEIAVFACADDAIEAAVASFIAGRRTTLALPSADDLAVRVRAASLECREARRSSDAPSGTAPDARRRPFAALAPLVEAAREAETLVLSGLAPSPFAPDGERSSLAPRELLELRARAPRPLLVLDLRNEDTARTPLTQPALLLPGTVIVRAFGASWREAGASSLAGLAFLAGPREILTACPAGAAIADDRIAGACDELDNAAIERLAYRRAPAAERPRELA